MLNRGEIFQKTVEMADVYFNSDHELSLRRLNSDLTEFLRGAGPDGLQHLGIDAFEIAARQLIRELDKNRRPRITQEQAEFFQDECWVPVGNRIRVKMGMATREDVLSVTSMTLSLHEKRCVSVNRERHYYETVLDLFSPELQTLGAIHATYPNVEQMNDPYKTAEWFALRDTVLREANYVCSVCGGKGETAHHTTYVYGIICDKKHLLPVCWPCHKSIHV